MDLLLRNPSTGAVSIRVGKLNSGGTGIDLASLGNYALSGSPSGDPKPAASGWSGTSVPLIQSLPDVTGDGKADLWAVKADGSADLYAGGTSSLTWTMQVISYGWTYGSEIQRLG
jgi:hypothetical protein